MTPLAPDVAAEQERRYAPVTVDECVRRYAPVTVDECVRRVLYHHGPCGYGTITAQLDMREQWSIVPRDPAARASWVRTVIDTMAANGQISSDTVLVGTKPVQVFALRGGMIG